MHTGAENRYRRLILPKISLSTNTDLFWQPSWKQQFIQWSRYNELSNKHETLSLNMPQFHKVKQQWPHLSLLSIAKIYKLRHSNNNDTYDDNSNVTIRRTQIAHAWLYVAQWGHIWDVAMAEINMQVSPWLETQLWECIVAYGNMLYSY